MTPYLHKVQYYETDRMGVTHHSNYIRWMEEARVDMLEQMGWGYDRMEAMGIQSPVIGLECRYRAPTTFGDQVDVAVSVQSYRCPRLVVAYEMRKADGTLAFTGESSHCFMDRAGKFLRLAKALPEFDAALRAQLPAEERRA